MKSNADDDRARVARILALLEDDDRGWLQDQLAKPWQRRARRLAQRDTRIREYALGFHPFASGRAMAAAIAGELLRYRASGWRFEKDLPAPAEARRGLLWRILHLNNGKSPSPGAVRAALAGILVVARKKPRKLATQRGTAPRSGLQSRTSWNVNSGEATDRG
jgi:hypothetical protein